MSQPTPTSRTTSNPVTTAPNQKCKKKIYFLLDKLPENNLIKVYYDPNDPNDVDRTQDKVTNGGYIILAVVLFLVGLSIPAVAQSDKEIVNEKFRRKDIIITIFMIVFIGLGIYFSVKASQVKPKRSDETNIPIVQKQLRPDNQYDVLVEWDKIEIKCSDNTQMPTLPPPPILPNGKYYMYSVSKKQYCVRDVQIEGIGRHKHEEVYIKCNTTDAGDAGKFELTWIPYKNLYQIKHISTGNLLQHLGHNPGWLSARSKTNYDLFKIEKTVDGYYSLKRIYTDLSDNKEKFCTFNDSYVSCDKNVLGDWEKVNFVKIN